MSLIGGKPSLTMEDSDYDGYPVILHRRLQETESNNDGTILRNTFLVYGPIWIGTFLLFCWLRRRWPRPYQLRNWVENIQTPIAENQHGFFSWIWQLRSIPEDVILDQCGMDSLCYLRLLWMGYRIACISALNAAWLMPLYATAPASDETDYITDSIVQTTIANVENGSNRMIGTVLAAYVLFGYVMWLILQEFDWFIEKRHKYLRKPLVQNYSVFVRSIPYQYRSNTRLEQYFKNCFSEKAVVEARLKVKAKTLAGAVKKRNAIVSKLEHALNYEQVKGETPMHRDVLRGIKVHSIPFYSNQLKEANSEVVRLMGVIENNMVAASLPERPDNEFQAIGQPEDPWKGRMVSINENATVSSELPVDVLDSTHRATSSESDPILLNELGEGQRGSSSSLTQGVNLLASKTGQGMNLLASAAKDAAKSAVKLVAGTGEGEFFSDGFVTFSSLGFANAALQMVHHEKPFEIKVTEAPHPDDIFWMNVGRSHKDLQLGKLISLAATGALCLLWTIPMAFVASLNSVKAISEKSTAIRELLDAMPFLAPLLEILAPLLVKVVNALLPTILGFLSMFEGPVSNSVLAASTFGKLAAFMIIQTFFVSAISGSLLDEIGKIIEKPTSIINLLAETLPSQATYFIQIVFVGTVVTSAMEILRVVPLIMALLRSCLPPNLTEKERQTAVLGIRPFADPGEFGHADSLAQIVLNFIVMLVYAVIAPLTVFIQGFCFLFMLIVYKHQFVYIYPANPDSGGKIWVSFIKILMMCMLIAEFTICGLMALKKALVATPMMIPLIVVTVLFNAYIRQEHFRVAEFLPSREALKTDLRNGDFDMQKDAYLQEELQIKEKYPQNLSRDRALDLGLVDEEHEIGLPAKAAAATS